jgi:hypothetical protein
MHKNKKGHWIKLLIFLTLINPIISSGAEARDYLPLKNIVPGMTGFGLTVFKGERIEKFRVKIIGILHNSSPKRSLILARCYGKKIEFAKVQQGMSGSPVYIKGKLIGAIAYTWSNALEPVAGIQPIESMLEILNRRNINSFSPSRFNFKAATLFSKYPDNIQRLGAFASNSALRSVPTPLIISGFNSSVYNYLKNDFANLGFDIQTGGSGHIPGVSASKTLSPGDAVAVKLVSGDANMSAVGTVTYKKGNKVLIFGHPLLKRGSVEYPMSRAYVHWIFASRALSWKIASATNSIGTIYQDREAGVYGVIGKVAKILPVHISVKDADGKKVYKYNIVRDPVLFIKLFSTLMLNSIFEKTNGLITGTVDYNIKINFTELKTGKKHKVHLKDLLVSATTGALLKNLKASSGPILFIMYNWFKQVRIDKINASIRIDNRFRASSIDSVRVLKNIVNPGEELPILITFKPFRGESFIKLIKVRIPENYNEQTIEVFIGSTKIESLTHQRFFKSYYSPKNIKFGNIA